MHAFFRETIIASLLVVSWSRVFVLKKAHQLVQKNCYKLIKLIGGYSSLAGACPLLIVLSA